MTPAPGGRVAAVVDAELLVEAGDLEGLEAEVRVRGIWAKAAELATGGAEGKTQVWA
jgi:hypothetical protein